MDTLAEIKTGPEPGNKDVPVIVLPDDLRDWASRHEPMISRLSQSISSIPAALPEASLWELIAETWSAEWTQARAQLTAAENDLENLMKPENRPLGLIGSALHGEETNAAEQRHSLALADFTIINETLRQQEELHRLLRAALDYQQMLGKSLDISRKLAGITDAFAHVASDDPHAAPDFSRAAERRAEQEPLSFSFRHIAAKLMGKQAALKPGKPAGPEAAP